VKEKKSIGELEAMIMHEVRKHPDWSHVLSVAITEIVRTSVDHANWTATFLADGARHTPSAARELVIALSNRFDLA
jgi:hypothetical protein